MKQKSNLVYLELGQNLNSPQLGKRLKLTELNTMNTKVTFQRNRVRTGSELARSNNGNQVEMIIRKRSRQTHDKGFTAQDLAKEFVLRWLCLRLLINQNFAGVE